MAQAFTMEMLPATMTWEAVVEAMGASMVWLLHRLWSWLVAARGAAVENLRPMSLRNPKPLLRLAIMTVPIANLSAAVAGAAHAAQAFAMEMIPAAVTREAVVEAMARLLRHLWSWLVAAKGAAVENLPVAAVSAIEASEPWLQMATQFFHGLYVWLLAAVAFAVENLPGVAKNTVEASQPWLEAAAKLMHGLYEWLVTASAVAVEILPEVAKNAAGSAAEASQPWLAMASKLLQAHDLCGWLVTAGENKPVPEFATAAMGRGGGAESSPTVVPTPTAGHGGVAVYALLAVALLAVAFLGGAVCALTCRTMKAPGLGGARVPRAMFRASPRRYYAAVRTARKARRGVSGAGWKFVAAAAAAAALVVCIAYVCAKMLN
uniref:Uncharacterized protein n=1 Tax=Leersia perrieri TaxID=77586 RepID=A0A0D9VV92_9ORYZ